MLGRKRTIIEEELTEKRAMTSQARLAFLMFLTIKKDY
jgi:hypothetical protein